MIVEMGIFNSLEIFLCPFLDLCSSTTFRCTSSLCSWVFPIVSPHICTPVEQEVMVDLLRVPYQTGELKNVKHDWKYTSVRFYYKIFLGVPIIVAHRFWGD